MSTTANRLALLSSTKADIKAALTEQGREPSDVFSSYGDEIRAIVADGGSGDTGDLDALIDGSPAKICSNAVSVRAYAFYMHEGLSEVEFPLAVSIGIYAFYVNPYENEVEKEAHSSLTMVNFPRVTNIETSAFQYSSLSEANFPAAITIGSSAFQECTALTSASFPLAENIGEWAFQHCGSLTNIDFPLVTDIGYGGFVNCTNLANISFPKATTIGNDTFSCCVNITHADFPLATSIAYSMLQGCTRLVSTNFPSATVVNGNAFSNCTALTKLDFPLVTSIGTYAFSNCSSLTALILRRASVCTLANANALTNSAIAKGTGYIYVPSALVASYEAATNWATYAKQIRAIEDYPAITGG